jgi:hypothetical protein
MVIAWWIITRRRGEVLWGLGSALLVLCGLLAPLCPSWALDYASAMPNPPLYWQAPVLGTVLRIVFGWDRNWLQYLPTLVVGPLVLIALHRRRVAFAWTDTASPVLLLSVPTAAYGWSFDQLVLLLPYLQVVAWWRECHHGNLISSLMVATGLLSANGLTPWVSLRVGDDLYLPWGPLPWGSLHVVARWAPRAERPGAVLAGLTEERA